FLEAAREWLPEPLRPAKERREYGLFSDGSYRRKLPAWPLSLWSLWSPMNDHHCTVCGIYGTRSPDFFPRNQWQERKPSMRLMMPTSPDRPRSGRGRGVRPPNSEVIAIQKLSWQSTLHLTALGTSSKRAISLHALRTAVSCKQN